MSLFFEMGRTNFILKKKKSNMSPRVSPIFSHCWMVFFGFPLTIRRTSWTPFVRCWRGFHPTRRRDPSGGRWSRSRQVEPMAGNPQGARGFWYLQRSFSEEKNCTNLTRFFVNISHVTSWKHLYWIWIWSLNLKNHKILKLLVKLDSKILIWC